jgi:enoyl-CoA hydratase
MTEIIVRRHSGVATVSINNAARLNCLGRAQIIAFIDAVTTLGDDPDLRVLIVTGEGDRAFMGGANMHIASDNAVFGMPEVKIGLPSVVEAALLPQLIGWGRTKLLLYTGDNIDARTALEWGLVEKVVPAAELDSALDRWVESIVESGPKAIRLQKDLIREWEALPVNDAIEAGIRCMYRAYQSDEPARMVDEALQRLKARKRG